MELKDNKQLINLILNHLEEEYSEKKNMIEQLSEYKDFIIESAPHYFYFNSGIATRREFESMRFNNEVFSRLVNLKKFLLYLNRFHQKALQKRVGLFLEFMKNA